MVIYPRFQLRLWQVVSLDVDFHKLAAWDRPAGITQHNTQLFSYSYS